MRRVIVMCLAAVFLTAGMSLGDTLRYRANGPWQDLDDGTHGWVSPDAPDATDTVRANWGGAEITLDYETTVNKFEAGVDESGIFHILAGGVLNTNAGNNKVGNNNACTGTLIVDAGGTVNSTGWLMIAGNSTVTGIAEISGTLNSAGHLWMATGTGSTATLTINEGGVVNVGGNIGLGTVNASTPSGGVATVNVNFGGLLNLNHWDDSKSIQNGSVLNIDGGVVVIGGNRVTAVNNYAAAGKIKAYGGEGTVDVVYNSSSNKTTVLGLHPMNPMPAHGAVVAVPVGEIAPVDLSWTNLDPNYAGDPVYVDVWFGTDPNKLSQAYTQVVTAGENVTSVQVNAPVTGTPTTYYWQVDSYIYGNPTESPIEGDLFRFDVTDDLPPTVVIETPGTVTWPGQPVQLNATISDAGTSAVSVAWSANVSGVVFSPSADVEDPVVTVDNAAGEVILTCTAWDDFNGSADSNADSMILHAAADACDAAGVAGISYDMDIAEPFCVIDIADLAAVASDWLADYALTEPTPIQ